MFDNDGKGARCDRACLPTCAPGFSRQSKLTLRSVPRPLQDEKGRVAIGVSDARTQLLGDYGHKRCRWQPVDLVGSVVGDRSSVGTG